MKQPSSLQKEVQKISKKSLGMEMIPVARLADINYYLPHVQVSVARHHERLTREQMDIGLQPYLGMRLLVYTQ